MKIKKKAKDFKLGESATVTLTIERSYGESNDMDLSFNIIDAGAGLCQYAVDFYSEIEFEVEEELPTTVGSVVQVFLSKDERGSWSIYELGSNCKWYAPDSHHGCTSGEILRFAHHFKILLEPDRSK